MDRRHFIKTLGVAGAGGLAAGKQVEAAQAPEFKTKHLIWIMNGNGKRKKEFTENPELQPNYARILKESFVFEEDHNNTVSEHGNSWTEYLMGHQAQGGVPLYPTPPNYVRKHYGDKATNYFYLNGVSYYRQWRFSEKYFTWHPDYDENSRPISLTATHIFNEMFNKGRDPRTIVREEFPDMGVSEAEFKQLEEFVDDALERRLYDVTGLRNTAIPRDPFLGDAMALQLLPAVMKAFKPRMLLYQQVGHDTGHGAGGYLRQQTGYFEYERVAKTTDEQLGVLFDFIKNDPYFSKNTAIIIRPEFGRDDEINLYGEINHSSGYYYCQRSASIWWGPDFKVGSSKDIVNRLDVAPTITKLMGGDATYSEGLFRPQMLKDELAAEFEPYRSYTAG